MAVALTNLGDTLHALGDLADARRHLERALAIRQDHLGADQADQTDIATTLSKLGNVLHDQGDLERARTLLERALAVYEDGLGSNHPETIQSRQALAALAVEE